MTYVDEVIDHLLKIEGGYVNDPSDSGGETNFGITAGVARSYGYHGQMKNLTRAMAHHIYKALYWEKPQFDQVYVINPQTAAKLFDIGVNMGVKRASEFLQRLLNVYNNRQSYWPDLVVDGDIGPKTLDVLSAYGVRRGSDGFNVMTKSLTCLQGAFYIELAERREKDEKFVYGWISNRIS